MRSGSSHPCDALVTSLLVACVTLAVRLLARAVALDAVPHDEGLNRGSATATLVDFAGSEVAIRSGLNGRYLEVGADGWIFASAFTHNKASARFDVEGVPPDLLRSLAATREYHERSGAAARRWDMRQEAAATGAWAGYAADSGGAVDNADYTPNTAEQTEAEDAELARRRLARTVQEGVHGWVVLRSPYAGGYMEVIGTGEDSEYVVRIADGAKLSYRSLFLIGEEGLWSHGVGGFLNWRRPTSSEPQQHVRAHGNEEPWGPLRTLTPSARFRVFRPPPIVDLLGRLACPSDAPSFDWSLLLDAARAGSCDSSGLEALRTAATALEVLDAVLGDSYNAELADLASAYRTILLEEDWQGVLDLQLTPCTEPDGRNAGSVGGGSSGGSKGSSSFSWLDEGSGELFVDRAQCPNAAFSEVVLRPLPDEALPLDLRRFEGVDDVASVTAEMAAASPAMAQWLANTTSDAPRPLLRATLESDAAFVLCDYADPSGGTNVGEYMGGAASAAGDGEWLPEGELEDEGEFMDESEGEERPPTLQRLLLRVSPRTRLHGSRRHSNRSDAEAATTYFPIFDRAADGSNDFNGTLGPDEYKTEPRAAGAAEAAVAAEERKARSAQLSVLLLMIDATSRAHMQRMMPRSLSVLRALAASGAATLYEFPFYSIVGFNSLPNMVPMLTGEEADALINTPPLGSYGHSGYFGTTWGNPSPRPPEAVWKGFSRRGYATFLLEELHDGCADLTSSGTPSSVSKLFYSRYGASGMPHHNAWQIFCQPEIRPCCTDPDSFLRPGRRQCVGGAELPEQLLDYVRQLFRLYGSQGTPRMGLLNLMSAHEHFMVRLGALDAVMRRFLLAIEAHLRRDTALFLLSDHGTHGIWYNHFAVGQAEHRTPALYLLLPAGFAKAHPAADAALRRNQRRRVTAYDLHATLRHLAEWPIMPRPAEEATSLFTDLPDERNCEAARVPAEWCLEMQAEAQCASSRVGIATE